MQKASTVDTAAPACSNRDTLAGTQRGINDLQTAHEACKENAGSPENENRALERRMELFELRNQKGESTLTDCFVTKSER